MKTPLFNDLYTVAGEALRDAPVAIPWTDYPRP